MRWVLVALGWLCIFLGGIGILLPLLPTTPFFLLAAYLFARSSPRLHQKLLQNPIVGPMIGLYQEHKVISVPVKMLSVCLLWLFIGYSIWKLIPLFLIKLLLISLAVGVSWFILKHPSREK